MKQVTLTLAAVLALQGIGRAQTVITDADLTAGSDVTWTADTEYIVDGLTYLEEGGSLTIDAGTVVKFRTNPSDVTGGDNTSALIITRGAQIFVNGRADAPVIFTFDGDDVDDPDDIDILTRGQWGGLIILGNATVARPGGIDQIEGIPANAGPRAQFGGGDAPDDDDDSGSITYLSIRHGGKALSSGDEINGLTLGGVGRGTTIDYVEVFANDDDGIEWFGGTVDVKHASVAFGKDDSYDYDYGWRGRGQYWFSINSDDISGRAGEHDGASPDDQAPFANPTIANATYIGAGVGSTPGEDGNDFAIEMRDNAGGKYYNSIFTDFPEKFLRIEDLPGDAVDTRERLAQGDIVFAGNVIGAFGDGTEFADIVTAAGEDNDAPDVAGVIDAVDDDNVISDAELVISIGRTTDGELDPRPAFESPLLDSTGRVATEDFGISEGVSLDFFDNTDYVGAFSRDGADFWLSGWTALDAYGILSDSVVVSVEDVLAGAAFQLFPNPASDLAVVTFELKETSDIRIELFDASARRVASQIASFGVGPQQVQINTADLVPGTYTLRLVAGGGTTAKQLIVR